jgi:hypothetical protein
MIGYVYFSHPNVLSDMYTFLHPNTGCDALRELGIVVCGDFNSVPHVQYQFLNARAKQALFLDGSGTGQEVCY